MTDPVTVSVHYRDGGYVSKESPLSPERFDRLLTLFHELISEQWTEDAAARKDARQ